MYKFDSKGFFINLTEKQAIALETIMDDAHANNTQAHTNSLAWKEWLINHPSHPEETLVIYAIVFIQYVAISLVRYYKQKFEVEEENEFYNAIRMME